MRHYNRKSRKPKKTLIFIVVALLAGSIWFLSRDIPAPTHKIETAIDNARFGN